MLKLETGKYYKTSDGRKVGPMQEHGLGFREKTWDGRIWNVDGEPYGKNNTKEDTLFEIPSSESPIREVTRRELVAGKYGVVYISSANEIGIASRKHTPEQLREAAHTLNQIAEYLESEGK